MRSRTSLVVLTLACLTSACAPASAPPVDRDQARADAEAVLTEFHRLASEGDFEPYFELFTPDAVFMGTDASERWSVEEFRGYASGSNGWTYRMTERHVFLDEDANTAWFDERLDNDRFGETRGTGVLVRTPDGWKITQYNLTIPVPNELAIDLVDRIRGMDG